MIVHKLTRTHLFTSLLFLSACGGSGRTVVNHVERPVDLIGFTIEKSLDEEISRLSISDLSAIQSRGLATYEGALSGAVGTDEGLTIDLVGLLSITADISSFSSEFAGVVSDFVTTDAIAIPGELVLTEAFFDQSVDTRIDFSFSGILDGVLHLPASKGTEFSIKLEGDFFGNDATFMGGGAVGIGAVAGERLTFTGRFAAQDQ